MLLEDVGPDVETKFALRPVLAEPYATVAAAAVAKFVIVMRDEQTMMMVSQIVECWKMTMILVGEDVLAQLSFD